jgi:peptide subunit release factor 1 (eRF1)
MEDEVIVTDKLNLTYLQANEVYPIRPPQRINNQVQFIYRNDEQFHNVQLNFMKDKTFKDYKMAEKTIEQMLRSTR